MVLYPAGCRMVETGHGALSRARGQLMGSGCRGRAERDDAGGGERDCRYRLPGRPRHRAGAFSPLNPISCPQRPPHAQAPRSALSAARLAIAAVAEGPSGRYGLARRRPVRRAGTHASHAGGLIGNEGAGWATWRSGRDAAGAAMSAQTVADILSRLPERVAQPGKRVSQVLKYIIQIPSNCSTPRLTTFIC